MYISNHEMVTTDKIEFRIGFFIKSCFQLLLLVLPVLVEDHDEEEDDDPKNADLNDIFGSCGFV